MLGPGDSGRPYKVHSVSKYYSKGENGSSVPLAGLALLCLSDADIYFKVHLVGPPRIGRAELRLDLQTHPSPALKTLPNKFSSPLATPIPHQFPRLLQIFLAYAYPYFAGTTLSSGSSNLLTFHPKCPTSFVRIPVVGSHSGSDPTTSISTGWC